MNSTEIKEYFHKLIAVNRDMMIKQKEQFGSSSGHYAFLVGKVKSYEDSLAILSFWNGK